MKVFFNYKVWLTPWGVEQFLRAEKMDESALTICNAGMDMTKHGYQEVSEGQVSVDLRMSKNMVAAAAVEAIRQKIDEEHKKYDKRVAELLDQIRRFESLTFNPTTGQAE